MFGFLDIILTEVVHISGLRDTIKFHLVVKPTFQATGRRQTRVTSITKVTGKKDNKFFQ
jgi:hypothetical protein